MKDTLCWCCAVAGTSGCSWDKELKPVPGWTAKRTKLRMQGKGYDDSYVVEKCPLYQEDPHPDRPADPHGPASKLSDEALERWLRLGLTDLQIAERCGLKRETVANRRRKYKQTSG